MLTGMDLFICCDFQEAELTVSCSPGRCRAVAVVSRFHPMGGDVLSNANNLAERGGDGVML